MEKKQPPEPKKSDIVAHNAKPAEEVKEDPLVPKVLHERYNLEKEIGHGAHGRIYIGRDSRSRKRIAIKLVRLPFNGKDG